MRIRLGVLTDIHMVQDTAREAAWINRYDFVGVEQRCRQALALFERSEVDCVLLLGDLAHESDLPSLRGVLRPLAAGLPVLAMGGNHDGPRPTDRLTEAGCGSLRLPGWRAVWPVAGRPGPARVAGLRVVRRARLRFAAARAPALGTWDERLVLLASHFPLLSRKSALTDRELPYAGDLVDRAALAEPLCARAGPTVVVCGHLHVRDRVSSGTLLQLSCGALIEPPFEATIIELRDGPEGVEVERTAQELGEASERRDPRLAPARESWRFLERSSAHGHHPLAAGRRWALSSQ